MTDQDPGTLMAAEEAHHHHNGLIDLGWGRKHLRIVGPQTVVVVVLAVALGFHIYLAWRQNEKIGTLLDKHTAQMAAITEQHVAQATARDQATEEFTYLLAAPPAERERLYRILHVPERFRQMRRE